MSDRTAIVSGGTFGIGRAITLKLAGDGFHVVAFGLDSPQPSSTAADSIASVQAEIDAMGVGCSGVVLEADVTEAGAVDRVVSEALDHNGRIDALVNNAAIGPLGTILDTDENLWDLIMAVNLKGPYLTSRAVVPHMIESGGGAIVNVGSGAGYGKPNMAAYAASKGGVHTLSAAMAYDFLHAGVRVNTVIPGGGGIVSGMSLGRAGGDEAVVRGRAVPGTAAGRPAEPTDIANAVSFLVSDEANTISGTVVDVGCFTNQGGPAPTKVYQ